MAIFTNVYGDGHTPDYEGCVLDWYEHNGYDDSDWYAICWNEEKQTIDKVLFDTTRCACSGRAEIDATPEVLRKVYHYWKTLGKSLFDGRTNRMQAMKIHVGDTVRVIARSQVQEGERRQGLLVRHLPPIHTPVARRSVLVLRLMATASSSTSLRPSLSAGRLACRPARSASARSAISR